MNSHPTTITILTVLLLGCSSLTGPRPDKTITVGQEFTLEVGQTGRTIDSSLAVTFSAVPQESRCPPDVDCIWAGFARVSLAVATTSEESILLSTSDEMCCTADTLGAYTFKLVRLVPVPLSDETDPEYVVTMLVTTS